MYAGGTFRFRLSGAGTLTAGGYTFANANVKFSNFPEDAGLAVDVSLSAGSTLTAKGKLNIDANGRFSLAANAKLNLCAARSVPTRRSSRWDGAGSAAIKYQYWTFWDGWSSWSTLASVGVSLQTDPFQACAYASVAGSNVGGCIP